MSSRSKQPPAKATKTPRKKRPAPAPLSAKASTAAAAVIDSAAKTIATRAAVTAPKMEARSMAIERTEKKFSCWNCDAFQPEDPAHRVTGDCRKAAPRVACARIEAVIDSAPPVSVKNDGGPAVWPNIEEGNRHWCGEWTLSTDPVPAVPAL